MKRLFFALGLLFLMAPLAAIAQGPDDTYVQIYQMIQQADQLQNTGQNRQAQEKYAEAQAALQKLQANHPDWNPKVVQFRLKYLADKLPPLTPPPAAPAKKPPIEAEAPAAPAAPAGDQAQQIQLLTQSLRQLEADKALLQQKLQEALAARPAAIDPAELKKAEDQIKTLEKERDLLKVRLEQAEKAPRPETDPAALEKAHAALSELTLKLAQQTEAANALAREKQVLEAKLQQQNAADAAAQAVRAENENLKKRLTELESAAQSADRLATLEKELAAAKTTAKRTDTALQVLQMRFQAAQEQIGALQKQKDELEKRTAQAAAPADSDKLKQLEKERDDLAQKLKQATAKAPKGKRPDDSQQVAELSEQLAALRARLEVYEARKVPYTPEELALLKSTPAETPKPETVTAPASKRDLPAGSGALVDAAGRAFAAKRYAEAEQKFEQLLQLDDKNVFSLNGLAASQLEQNKLTQADATLKRALAQAPDDPKTLMLHGILRFRQDKFDEALEAFTRAVAFDPKSSEAQNYLGMTLSQKGQNAPAEAALRKALQLEPGYAPAHYNLAVVYATQDPPYLELARWHYQKALAGGHPRNGDLEKMIERNPPPPEKK